MVSAPVSHIAGRNAGIAVVEVLGGLAVFAIVLLAAFQSQLSSFAVTKSSRELSTAAADLEGAMESLLVLPTDEIPVAGSEFEEGQPVTRFTDLHLPNQTVVATYPDYTPGGPVPDQLVIVLTLSWTDARGRARQIQARTVKLR